MKSLFALMFVVCSACCMASETNALVHLMESQPQGTNDYRKFHAYSTKTGFVKTRPAYETEEMIHMWDGEFNRRSSIEREDGEISVYHNQNSLIWDDLVGSNTLVLTSDSISFTNDALHLPFAYARSIASVSNRVDGIAKGCYSNDELEFATNKGWNVFGDEDNPQIFTIPSYISIEICASLDNYTEYPTSNNRFGILPINCDMTLFSLSGGFTCSNKWYSPYSISLTRDSNGYFKGTNGVFIGKTDTFGYSDSIGQFRTRRCYWEPNVYNLFGLSETYSKTNRTTMFTITCNFLCRNVDDNIYVSKFAYTQGCYFPNPDILDRIGFPVKKEYQKADAILITKFGGSFDSSPTVTNLYTRYYMHGITSRDGYSTADSYFLDDNTTKVGGFYSATNGYSRMFGGKIHCIRVYHGYVDPLDGSYTKHVDLDRHRRNAKIDYERFFEKRK